MTKEEKVKELKKEIDREIYFAQALTNNYDKVTKLRNELKTLRRLNK